MAVVMSIGATQAWAAPDFDSNLPMPKINSAAATSLRVTCPKSANTKRFISRVERCEKIEEKEACEVVKLRERKRGFKVQAPVGTNNYFTCFARSDGTEIPLSSKGFYSTMRSPDLLEEKESGTLRAVLSYGVLCPIPYLGIECPTPYTGEFTILGSSGEIVHAGTADEFGRISVSLKKGQYTLAVSQKSIERRQVEDRYVFGITAGVLTEV